VKFNSVISIDFLTENVVESLTVFHSHISHGPSCCFCANRMAGSLSWILIHTWMESKWFFCESYSTNTNVPTVYCALICIGHIYWYLQMVLVQCLPTVIWHTAEHIKQWNIYIWHMDMRVQTVLLLIS